MKTPGTCRRLAMTVIFVLLALRGAAPAQTPPPHQRPLPLPQGERLKVAAQWEREQNDPILMTVIFAAQYAPVYEALVEEDPQHNFVPMLATDWSMSPDGKTWTFNLRKGVPWHFGWGEFTARTWCIPCSAMSAAIRCRCRSASCGNCWSTSRLSTITRSSFTCRSRHRPPHPVEYPVV